MVPKPFWKEGELHPLYLFLVSEPRIPFWNRKSLDHFQTGGEKKICSRLYPAPGENYFLRAMNDIKFALVNCCPVSKLKILYFHLHSRTGVLNPLCIFRISWKIILEYSCPAGVGRSPTCRDSDPTGQVRPVGLFVNAPQVILLCSQGWEPLQVPVMSGWLEST